jgi:hypothetical protein
VQDEPQGVRRSVKEKRRVRWRDDESGNGDCRAGGGVCGGGTSARVFMTSHGPDVHVVLVRADDRALEQEGARQSPSAWN